MFYPVRVVHNWSVEGSMKLWQITYQAGWHNETMPLLTYTFVFARDSVDAINKLTIAKGVHCDNVRELKPVDFIQ
jgi:hypothetical protein